jgi:hypothetical protein
MTANSAFKVPGPPFSKPLAAFPKCFSATAQLLGILLSGAEIRRR